MHTRLKNSRCYLCGGMDRAEDGGVGWREDITPFLSSLDVHVLDPCNKPIDLGLENIEDKAYRQQLKNGGNFKELARQMRLIRITDLRMVDVSDFIIAHLDLHVYPMGTCEEIFLANRQKKPVLTVIKQGRKEAPDWLWGTLPEQHIFSSFDELKRYLTHIHCDNDVNHLKRWMFFQW